MGLPKTLAFISIRGTLRAAICLKRVSIPLSLASFGSNSECFGTANWIFRAHGETAVIKHQSNLQIWLLVFLLSVGFAPTTTPGAQADQLATLKQSLTANQKRLMEYQWTELTTVSVNNEQKLRTTKACRYDLNGQLLKQDLTTPAEQASPRGPRGRVTAKKEQELADYMQRAAMMIKEYVPPDIRRIEAARARGMMVKPTATGVQLWMGNYFKPRDTIAIEMKGDKIDRIHVDTYLDSEDDRVSLDANFTSLPDGTNYASQIGLVALKRGVLVMVENSNYQKPMVKFVPLRQPQKDQCAQVSSLTLKLGRRELQSC